MRACYFAKQKIVFTKNLANASVKKKLILKHLMNLPNEEINTIVK